jgi:TIR domain/Anaphase-promoting complex subunit 4 WD40 domain/WD40-like Beta Propeller Repeat/WD domain, G-beta repeat
MSKPEVSSAFKYDAFVSYSRRDSEFARRLEQALNSYSPPKDLGVPQRRLRVFRDESDFQGVEYHASLDRNLRESANLLVVCSPNSARSTYVEDEIRRFAQYRDKDHIIPLIIAGVPNNELKNGDEDARAFPEQLVKLLPIPLANDYRGFDARNDKLQKGRWASAWFKTLADIYADYQIDRSQIEQREQRRKLRNLRIITAAASVAVAILAALTTWALISRAEATRQRDLALARQYETEARLALDNSAQGLISSSLLSIASLQSSLTSEGYTSLMGLLQLLPPLPTWKNIIADQKQPEFARLAFKPDGSLLATAAADGEIRFWDPKTGRAIGNIEKTRGRNMSRTALAFSPDGKFLVSGCEHQACVIDVTSKEVQVRLPQPPDGDNHGRMVWSVAFSPDGRRLAAASYASNQVFLYDTETWRVVARLPHTQHTVHAAAFSPDGILATLAATGELRLWQPPDSQVAAAELRVNGTNIAFASRDRLITSSGELYKLIVDRTSGIRLERTLEGRLSAEQVQSVPGRSDACIIGGGLNTSVRLLCGEPFHERIRFAERTSAFALSPDGRWLAIQSKHALASGH